MRVKVMEYHWGVDPGMEFEVGNISKKETMFCNHFGPDVLYLSLDGLWILNPNHCRTVNHIGNDLALLK